MRKSRARETLAKGTSVVVPEEPASWEKWNVIETAGQTNALDFVKNVHPKLYPLAKDFSRTTFRLRLELRPATLIFRHRTAMSYLTYLSTLEEDEWPENISVIAEAHLDCLRRELALPAKKRTLLKNCGSRTLNRFVAEIKGFVEDAWRLGIAEGTIRPDLGGQRPRKYSETTSKKLYSRREFGAIVKFLLQRRLVPRGSSTNEERAYLAACILLIGAYLPVNRTGLFLANNDSLREGESDAKYDAIVVLKKRPVESVNWLPELKGSGQKSEAEEVQVNRVQGKIREIFRENIAFNKTIGHPGENALFCCSYPKSRSRKIAVFDRINAHSYQHGTKILQKEFDFIGDDGRRLTISLQKLRDTFENGLSKSLHMRDKADILNHKDENTTGTVYESITDDDHLRFNKGLKAIPIAISGDNAGAVLWAKENGLPAETVRRLIAGMLQTRTASCSDPIRGEFAPQNDEVCPNTLACFRCRNLAVVVSDLYRLASLERRINLDMDSGRLQGESRISFAFILDVIANDIFANFEIRHVSMARNKAVKQLHPLWQRPIDGGGL